MLEGQTDVTLQGAYSSDGHHCGAEFTMGSRHGEEARALSPGPGAYEISGSSGSSSPKFTIRGKTGPQSRSATPGPGDYLPDGLLRNPRSPEFSMTPRRELDVHDKFPGPGVGWGDRSKLSLGGRFRAS